ncbi:hypothetical protein SS1G_09399 [Sclerotinia sclerotiorum 1980 UF-70]|uniref:HTH psq-type domain-containing protein n=2 Tax=Sclerotinia sclerotiorum (strain ATCC 18683 / 1980 / Ss-1) TaxID=665079 RepID=A7EVP0_SCLS1|nr:hypothetical protein SS1G_09399 [Sclerotinia sclerotiorum 1980 UF-70]APA15761.1 hypothetical protein sscle_15g105310 [Sclerotinia sclerotiorum 1980 UF-70]EDN93532.1 hypothetical protein SS1G_09399 [Sclerotinia sclerotiorum 1980 UF-70]
METQSKEARIILAIEAIRKSKNLTITKAAKVYSVPRSTLRDRINDRNNQMETRANGHKITELEKKVLLQYIIDVDDRGFAPKLNDVEDMANYILQSRGAKKIGKL